LVGNRTLRGHQVHAARLLEPGAHVPQLRNVVLADPELPFGPEIDGARVGLVQPAERRRDLAPDALFFGGVRDERRPEALESVLAAECEQRLPAPDIRLVAEPGMPGLAVQPIDVYGAR